MYINIYKETPETSKQHMMFIWAASSVTWDTYEEAVKFGTKDAIFDLTQCYMRTIEKDDLTTKFTVLNG